MTDHTASPEVAPPAPRRRRWRRFAAAAAAVLLVVTGGALWFSRLTLAEGAGRDLLARFGLDEAELVVVELTPGHIVLADIIVGPGEALAIDRLEVRFGPAGLIAGRIDEVIVDGLRIHGSLDGQRLSLGPFDDVREATAGSDGDGAALVVPPVRLSGLEVFLDSPLGPLVLRAAGELGSTPDGNFLTDATIRLVAPGGFLDGTLMARRTPAGAVSATIAVDGGEIALAGALIGGLAGRLELTRGLDDPLPVLDGALRADAVSLAGGPPLPVDLLLDFDGDRLGFTAAVETPDGASRIDVTGAVEPLATPLTSSFTVALESADLSGLAAWLGLAGDDTAVPAGAARAHAVVRLSGSPARMSGEVRLTGEVADVTLPGVAADGATVAVTGRVNATPQNIILTLNEGGAVRLHGLRPEAVETPAPAELVLVPVGGIAGLDLAHPENYDWSIGLLAAPATMEIALPGDGGPLRLLAGLPALEISGSFRRPETRWWIDGSDGSLEIPAHDIRLDGLDVRAFWPALEDVMAGDAENPPAKLLQITGGRLRHTATPAWLPALGLDGTLYETASGYRFAGRARGPGGTPAFAIAADHDTASGEGRATIGMAPVALGGGGAAPEELSPALAGLVSEASGSLDSEVRLVWGEAGLATEVEILVSDLSATIADARLERINTVLTFDDRGAGAGPDMQEVAIAAMDIGVPLRDGRIFLALDDDGRLLVRSMTWRLAGGEVRADDFVLDPRADLQAFILDVEGVRLGELMAIFALEGLEAEGLLDGRIPVTLVGDELEIYQAELTTRGPGHIRYKPESYPVALDTQGAAVALLLQAVENFQYESLRLTVDREADGEAVIGLHLVGSNPDLHEGYPVNLNLTLSGRLDSIVREGLQSWRVPDDIRRRMEEFSR